MSGGDTEKVAEDNAELVGDATKKVKNGTVYALGSAGDKSEASVMNASAKETAKYTKEAKGMYKNAADNVDKQRKEQFKLVAEDAARQANASKVVIIKNAQRISEEKSVEANVRALKIASNDAKTMIHAASDGRGRLRSCTQSPSSGKVFLRAMAESQPPSIDQ